MHLHRFVQITALGFFLILILRAILWIDPYFDSFTYHLPFASRMAGLCPRSCYQMGALLEAIYDGYPRLFEWLFGVVWAISGSLQIAHLINVFTLALFCIYLRLWFQVPLAWSFVALIAVPVIQVHATSSYIDLPLNLAVGAVILSLATLAHNPAQSNFARLLLIALCLAFVSNSKYQMMPIAAILGIALFIIVALHLAKGRNVGFWPASRNVLWAQALLFFGFAGVLVSAWAIRNFIVYNNPFYPLAINAFGLTFAGPYNAVAGKFPDDWVSTQWLDVAAPVRWLASVLEIQAYGYRPLPWNVDQGEVPFEVPSFRMGGYFVPYVLFLMTFLAWRLGKISREYKLWLGITFALTTIFVAVLPAAHLLRYYLFWMVVLVSLCLVSVFSIKPVPAPRSTERGILGCGLLIALASVVLITGARYITPFGLNARELSRHLGIDAQIAAVADGEIVCVDPAWQPYTYLFAPLFHPGRRYAVLDGPIGPCTTIIHRD